MNHRQYLNRILTFRCSNAGGRKRFEDPTTTFRDKVYCEILWEWKSKKPQIEKLISKYVGLKDQRRNRICEFFKLTDHETQEVCCKNTLQRKYKWSVSGIYFSFCVYWKRGIFSDKVPQSIRGNFVLNELHREILLFYRWRFLKLCCKWLWEGVWNKYQARKPTTAKNRNILKWHTFILLLHFNFIKPCLNTRVVWITRIVLGLFVPL